MKLLFLVLICILLFLVFYKSNEGFNDSEYIFNGNIDSSEQEKNDILSIYLNECNVDYNETAYDNAITDRYRRRAPERMCPPNKPKCLGRSIPGHWGKCHGKNVLSCKLDYNEVTYNNGNNNFMCPQSHPKCYNYSETDSRLGTCIRPEKERLLKNCSGDYNSNNPLQSGTCPEYIPNCVRRPDSLNGICAHKDFHKTPYYGNHTSEFPNDYPICSRNYITDNENDYEIFLSLQQRDYAHHPRDPENRHHFHGNSVCPITEPICVGHSDNVWGKCQSSGTPSTHASAHPPQGTIGEDGTIRD